MNIKKYFNLKIVTGLIILLFGIILWFLNMYTTSLMEHLFPFWFQYLIPLLIISGLIILIWGILEKAIERMGKSKKILNIIPIAILIIAIVTIVAVGIIFILQESENNNQTPIESRLRCLAKGTTSNEFDIMNREFAENPNQDAIGFNMEIENIGDNLYEKKISLDIFKGCEIISEYGYKVIKILGFDDFYMDSYPVLPMLYLNHLELPKNSVIQEVKIQGSLPTEIRNIHLPAFNEYPKMVGGKAEPLYVDVDKNLYFDPISDPLWSQSDSFNSKDIVLKLIPVIYDSVKKTATVYSKIEVSIIYETTKTGILHNMGAEGNSNIGYFNANETITAVTILENTTNEIQEYIVKAELVDILGCSVKELSENISVEPNKRTRKEINMGKIAEMNLEYHLDSATLYLKINISDIDNREIGHQQKQLTVYNKK
jgi:hypothetical protein